MMPPRRKTETRFYDPNLVVDDPASHEYARALGLLTWSTWDTGVRPFDQRLKEFLSAFPPEDPIRFMPDGALTRRDDGSVAPGTRESRLKRFRTLDGRSGSLTELLARYGLRMEGAPALVRRLFMPSPLRETAQRRNVKLRVLHGAVDIEPQNMTAAKAEYLDREEKKRAALDVRDALRRMQEELATDPDE
jgi:hypothetical protein